MGYELGIEDLEDAGGPSSRCFNCPVCGESCAVYYMPVTMAPGGEPPPDSCLIEGGDHEPSAYFYSLCNCDMKATLDAFAALHQMSLAAWTAETKITHEHERKAMRYPDHHLALWRRLTIRVLDVVRDAVYAAYEVVYWSAPGVTRPRLFGDDGAGGEQQ